MKANTVIANYLNASLASPRGLTTDEHADCIVAALDAAGFQCVPKEPKEQMLLRGWKVVKANQATVFEIREIYRAMLAASTEPPKETPND